MDREEIIAIVCAGLVLAASWLAYLVLRADDGGAEKNAGNVAGAAERRGW